MIIKLLILDLDLSIISENWENYLVNFSVFTQIRVHILQRDFIPTFSKKEAENKGLKKAQ